jgi:hypothetical protein
VTSSSGPRRSGSWQAAAGAGALLLLVAAAVGLQMARERLYPAADEPQEVLYIASPDAVRRLALSFDAVMADIYWMRAIQFYGGTRLSSRADRNYDLLYPLLEITTSLDPRFSVAYRFGAFFLTEAPPGGPGRADLAIRLLDKAMAAQPDRWEYPHDVAFVHYRARDYARAAEWFERAADKPDAPTWLRPLVAAAQTARGDTNSARLVWRSLLDSENDFMRREANRRLMQLDAIDQIAQLARLSAAYAARAGGPPRTWQDLVRAGMLRGIPVDPTGLPYLLDPRSGHVTISRESALWPLTPEEPS